jgi:hypothetical protein
MMKGEGRLYTQQKIAVLIHIMKDFDIKFFNMGVCLNACTLFLFNLNNICCYVMPTKLFID